jgi:beta-fructofuranosidase
MARAKGNEGAMWECPNFARVEGHDVLILSPQDVKREINKFINVHQSGYFIGKLDYETGVYSRGEFEILDYGLDFYAPQITETPDGRVIMIAWLDMWGGRFPEDVDGWAGMMTIPRELHIKGNSVVSVPVKELEALRTLEKSYTDLTLYKTTTLDGVKGETFELIMDIDLTETEEFEIYLRASEDRNQKTVLSYNKTLEIFKFNRDESGEDFTGTRECPIAPADKMKLHIFVDRSSVEIFINDGEKTVTSRIYPRNDSTDIVFVPKEGGMKIDSVKFYELGVGIPQP